jgi:hypothetical protein
MIKPMDATVKVTHIGYPPAGSKVEVVGEIEPTGMNAGGNKAVRVRDERGRTYEMESSDLSVER